MTPSRRQVDATRAVEWYRHELRLRRRRRPDRDFLQSEYGRRVRVESRGAGARLRRRTVQVPRAGRDVSVASRHARDETPSRHSATTGSAPTRRGAPSCANYYEASGQRSRLIRGHEPQAFAPSRLQSSVATRRFDALMNKNIACCTSRGWKVGRLLSMVRRSIRSASFRINSRRAA